MGRVAGQATTILMVRLLGVPLPLLELALVVGIGLISNLALEMHYLRTKAVRPVVVGTSPG